MEGYTQEIRRPVRPIGRNKAKFYDIISFVTFQHKRPTPKKTFYAFFFSQLKSYQIYVNLSMDYIYVTFVYKGV